MEGVEVDGVLLHACRSEILLWVDGEVGVVALVSKEWGDAHGGVESVVVSKLCERQKFGPIVLLIVTINLQVLLEHLVHSLSLSIPFWVVTQSEVEVDVEGFAQGAEEVRNKFWPSIGGDVRGDPVLGEHVEQEELR